MDHSETSPEETILKEQQFHNWEEFEAFKEEISKKDSPIARFEKAADAISTGDAKALKQLLAEDPDLIHRHSTRTHHCALLHYVGANGFEGFRQKTPTNAVEIAEVLLKAGAEVDEVANLYRGTTTLGLVATSIHPVETGVQKPLIDIFLAYGADPNHAVAPDYTEGYLIVACLANGRGEAAAYLAQKGALLNLEAAAGVGDLDKVKSYFNEDGSLKKEATINQRDAGFMWACEYGYSNVVEFMLEKGLDIASFTGGMTGLHWATMGGHLELMQFLIDHKAPLEIKNGYGGTVLSQALWFAFNAPKSNDRAIIDLLIAAGAHVEPEWDQYIDEVRKRT